MQEQVAQLRDISISYRGGKVLVKVEMDKIVSEYFKYSVHQYSEKLKADPNRETFSYTDLSELKENEYDVTLNTENRQQSVMKNLGISFGSYNRKKHLRFHILDLKLKLESKQENVTNNIKFILYRANVAQSEYTLDIQTMTYYDLENQIRNYFNLDKNIPFHTKDIKNNTFFNLDDKSKKPIHILQKQKITSVGIVPNYEAGCC